MGKKYGYIDFVRKKGKMDFTDIKYTMPVAAIPNIIIAAAGTGFWMPSTAISAPILRNAHAAPHNQKTCDSP